MKITKSVLKRLIKEIMSADELDAAYERSGQAPIAGALTRDVDDKFVPPAAARHDVVGGIDMEDGTGGAADTYSTKRIINSEILNLKSALRADDIAKAKNHLKKISVFLNQIDTNYFPKLS